jgi:predicted protein tyrosine phosphatase
MSLIVCPLGYLHEVVEARRPSHVLTLLDPGHKVHPPLEVTAWLRLDFHDIPYEISGMTAPNAEVVSQLLAFAGTWDESEPMVIHCHAGISRSTAAAFIVTCARHPEVDEGLLAERLREASPEAYPNRGLIALADKALGRQGRMVAAIEAIGGNGFVSQSVPFEFWAPNG